MSKRMSPNQREAIYAYDPILGSTFEVQGTSANGAINVNATVSISGSPIPITGATTALVVGIVDGSGNQITNFGGGITSVVSTTNSSTAVLLSGATFTGSAWVDMLTFAEVRVSVFSNVASTTNGLVIQQSSDGTNVDFTDTYTIPAGTGKLYCIPRAARYARVVYTNGATNQTTFRLQTIQSSIASSALSSQRPSDSYSNETDMTQAWAFNSIYDSGTDTWTRAISGNGVTNAGTQRVTLSSDSTGQVKLAAGSAVIGHVITDTGSTTAVTGTVSTNSAQVNGVTTLTGNGVTGTGSQRVTIASDNTPFATKIDQTTPGTTNNVSLSVSTGAGTSALVKDDTTFGDGVTSGVASTANRLYNSTTTSYDRSRGITSTITSGTGVSATGGVAIGKTTNPTAVTDGQYIVNLADKLGKQVVVGSIRELKADAPLTITSSTAETTVIAAIAATFNDVYGCIVANTSATACEVVFRDVAAGTPRFSIYVPAGDTRGFMLGESAAYKQATVNTAWTAQCSASVASIKISLAYVKNT